MSQQETGKHTVVMCFRIDDELAELLEKRLLVEQKKTGFTLSKAKLMEAALRKYLTETK